MSGSLSQLSQLCAQTPSVSPNCGKLNQISYMIRQQAMRDGVPNAQNINLSALGPSVPNVIDFNVGDVSWGDGLVYNWRTGATNSPGMASTALQRLQQAGIALGFLAGQ